MKTTTKLFGLRSALAIALAAAMAIAMAGCKNNISGGTDDTIDIAAIPGVTAPETGVTPVTAITPTEQYSGTVAWKDSGGNSLSGNFAANTVYTAIITLTAKDGFTLQGVAKDFFTVAGASATNPANSGVITAVFQKATEASAFVSLTIKTQPKARAHGDTLDADFEVTVTYTDSVTSYKLGVFSDHNITMHIGDDEIDADTPLSHTRHNGKKISVQFGSHPAVETNAITVNKADPESDDFTVSGDRTVTYDGNSHAITVTKKDGTTTGTVTVKYNDSASAPTNTGTYTVTFDVTADDDWNAASGLNAGTLTINTIPVTFSGVTQNGDATHTTTELTLTFDKAIAGLSKDDITLSLGGSVITAAKGDLSGSGATYTLTVSLSTDGALTASNTLTVTVASPANYAVSGSPQTATIYYYTGAGFTIDFDADPSPSITGPTIHRSSDNGDTAATITVAHADTYDSIIWLITGTGIRYEGSTITLNARNGAYNAAGEYFITVEAVKNGVPYNTTVTFTVED